ncbi:hypothetical protein OsJ_12724 [Oryza sativa Japonica Group]|uniref:Uncharacterized protein n=1 Tax=Oryza sativa subsp. japonica TaxID=39947 RepID=A3AN20_ORYSJ|nr:hypothetical protein OsJ_12724 [Oryza sativa Japonica Group]
MGICVSCDAVAEGAATARVVMPGGELREYSQPATAAMALEEAGEGWFLCDADGVGFEGRVVAVPGDEELRPGQIYFVLHPEARRRSLTREEVAALAVKASAALVKGRRSGGGILPPREAVAGAARWRRSCSRSPRRMTRRWRRPRPSRRWRGSGGWRREA